MPVNNKKLFIEQSHHQFSSVKVIIYSLFLLLGATANLVANSRSSHERKNRYGKMMNKRFVTLALILSCFFCANVWAGPAAPIEVVLSQPDGTTFTAIQRGDEFANWIETSEGHSIVNDKGTWFYAERDNAGALRATSTRVGSLSRIELESMPLHVAPTPDPEAFVPRTIRKIPRSKADANQGAALSPSLPHPQYVLTVLVDYSDISFIYSDDSFQSLMYGASGSVKDFFLDNSYGELTITTPTESYGTSNDGIIHVARATTHPNPEGDSFDEQAEAREVVSLTDAYINYAAYDTNADGIVSPDELSIVIILAGYEGGYTAALTPNVWGHQWEFASSLTLDGVALQPYTMFGERHNTHQATIGVMCHELGHLMLGLPDLYDPDGSSNGIGNWGLMGGGGWMSTGTYLGDSPSHLSAWSKVATNFTIPEDIDTNQSGVSIAKADTNEATKRIWIDEYKLWEYFLVENRQISGYDAGLPGSGLLIWHIDDSQLSNLDESHKRVDVEAADGQIHLDLNTNRGDGGDPFPGSSNNQTFNNTSNPNSKDYSDIATLIGVTGISASSATMTANFTVPSVELGDYVGYFENEPPGAVGYGSTTVWAGIRALNDTVHTKFDGVDVYVSDNLGATIDIEYYSNMDGGTPSGLLHFQTGFAADRGWNRLLLLTPQSFPIGAERGVVLKIVGNSSTYPVGFVPSDGGSGRSYIDLDGVGTFYPLCPSSCGDLLLAALMSAPLPAPPAEVDASDGTYTDKIAISWSAVSAATSYNVYYSSSFDGSQTFLGSFTGTTVDAYGTAPGDVWYFWVYSVNAGGESATGTYDTGYIQSEPMASCNVNTVSSVVESSGTMHEACETLIVGPDFIAEDGASVLLSSGLEIEFMPNFLIESGATLDAAVCGKSVCETSPSPMPYGCHSCVVQICDIEPSCCGVAFDQSCLDMVGTECGLICE